MSRIKTLLQRWSTRKINSGVNQQNANRDTKQPQNADINRPEGNLNNRPTELVSQDKIESVVLQKLFSNQRFNSLDGLNEYDDDFTSFSPLGKLITHEMKRALAYTAKPTTNPGNQADDKESDQEPLNSKENEICHQAIELESDIASNHD